MAFLPCMQPINLAVCPKPTALGGTDSSVSLRHRITEAPPPLMHLSSLSHLWVHMHALIWSGHWGSLHSTHDKAISDQQKSRQLFSSTQVLTSFMDSGKRPH
eukprot:1016906-Pelagomonas_calceolata.AAC.1